MLGFAVVLAVALVAALATIGWTVRMLNEVPPAATRPVRAVLAVQLLWVERAGEAVAVDAMVLGVGVADGQPIPAGSMARFLLHAGDVGVERVERDARRCVDDDMPCVVVTDEGDHRVHVLVPIGAGGDHLELRADRLRLTKS